MTKNKAKLAETIADPADNPELFEEGWDAALEKEQARGEHVAEPNDAPAEQNGEGDEQKEDVAEETQE